MALTPADVPSGGPVPLGAAEAGLRYVGTALDRGTRLADARAGAAVARTLTPSAPGAA